MGPGQEPSHFLEGSDRCCCVSLLLFSLALAIHTNAAISGVKFGTSEHKIPPCRQYILIHLIDPANSVSALFQCLQENSAASGYKINLTKSEVLPLNTQDLDIRKMIEPLKVCPRGFIYFGMKILENT